MCVWVLIIFLGVFQSWFFRNRQQDKGNLPLFFGGNKNQIDLSKENVQQILTRTLRETNSSPLKMGHPKRKRSYSNFPFSGALAVSLREGKFRISEAVSKLGEPSFYETVSRRCHRVCKFLFVMHQPLWFQPNGNMSVKMQFFPKYKRHQKAKLFSFLFQK